MANTACIVLLSYLSLVLGIMIPHDIDSLNNELQDVQGKPDEVIQENNLFVLLFENELKKMVLKSASTEERLYFQFSVAPTIRRYEESFLVLGLRKSSESNNNTAKHGVFQTPLGTNATRRTEVIDYVNKFMMSFTSDFDNNDIEPNSETAAPHIVIYFKGPYSSLHVKLHNEDYNYFIPSQPFNSLSEYQREIKQNGVNYLEIPELARNEFLNEFSKLLIKLISFPV